MPWVGRSSPTVVVGSSPSVVVTSSATVVVTSSAMVVVVSSPAVPKPARVRYAWSSYPPSMRLFNKNGFPAFPFQGAAGR